MHTEVTVPNPSYELVPGMYASVEIPLRGAQNAIALPVQAVHFTTEGEGIILVVNGENRIEERHVPLGIQTADEIEIRSDLREGELVILGSVEQYKQGELVSPREANLPGNN